MIVNGKDFELYTIDTPDTVLERIAFRLSTAPRWLIVDPPLPSNLSEMKSATVSAIDFLSEIRDRSSLSVPTGPFPDGVSEKEVQDIFVITNATLAATSQDHRRLLFQTMKGFLRAPEDSFRDVDRILASLSREIDSNAEKVDGFFKLTRELDSVCPVEFTKFELDHAQFTLEFDLDVSLEFLFDRIETSARVPFAVMSVDSKLFYKIFGEFEIDPDWLDIRLDNALFLKIDSELDDLKPLATKFKKFTNAAFSVDKRKVAVTMDTNIGARFISRKAFSERTLSAFSGVTWPTPKTHDNLIVVYYSIPRQCMDPAIFAELVMNDPVFNSVVAIDESVKASKVTSSVYLHRLNSTETVNVAMKQTVKHNQFGMINIGEPYIRCRLKTTDSGSVEPLQILIGKLFGLYNRMHDEIVSEYAAIIAKFHPVKCAKPSLAPKKLGTIAPEIFFPTFSRICAYGPTVVTPGQAVPPNAQTMDFPVKGEVFEGKRVQTRTFVCPTEKHRFVGLRENTLANKSVFPFIPCCFAQDQTGKTGSLYRKYYFGETESKRGRKPQETTSLQRRILEKNDTEVLPANLRKLFSIVDPDPNVEYLRVGISRTKHASVEALLLGLRKFAYKSTRQITIANKVAKEVARIKTLAFAMAAKQELYDYSVEEILNLMETSDWRPSRFVRVLELAFSVNIFVLTASDDDLGGSLLVPRHAKMYLKFKPTRTTFFLFQHSGTEQEEYPHVELVARTSGENFFPGDAIVDGIYRIFNEMTTSLVNGVPIPPLKSKKLPIVGQRIDAFGKCRMINVAHDNVEITVVTDPLPPFAVPPIEKINRVAPGIAMDFASKWNLPINSQRIWNGSVRELETNVGVRAVILCDGTPLEKIQLAKELSQFEGIDASDALAEFALADKASAILLEYALWNLSKFLSRSRTVNDLELSRFAGTKMTLVPANHTYDPFESERFSEESSFQSGGKLLISSEDLLKRLMFACRLIIARDPKRLASYETRTFIPNYYSYVGDFSKSGKEFVLEGREAVENLLKTYSNGYEVFNTVFPSDSFFFKNDLVSRGATFLANRGKNFETATAIVTLWSQRGFNSREVIAEEIEKNERERVAVDVYAYHDPKTIEKISDASGVFEGAILATAEDEPKFIALMKLR